MFATNCCRAETWSAGAAAVAITPTKPMWMGGYASRTEPSQGKIHDLFAKTLVIEDGAGGREVIVTLDLLGTPKLRAMVADGAKREYLVQHNELLINASDTHCGPEIREGLILQRVAEQNRHQSVVLVRDSTAGRSLTPWKRH